MSGRILPWLLIGLMAGCDAGDNSTGKATPPDPMSGYEIDAQVQADKAVRQFLKFPHDADFGWFDTQVLSRNEDGTRWGLKRKDNGELVELDLDRLCQEDQDWINGRR